MSRIFQLQEIHFSPDFSFILDTLRVLELCGRKHFSFGHVLGLILERQKVSFTSFPVLIVQVQKLFFSVTRLVRMISSFHCPTKEEKFCGCKYVDNSEWEAKYLAKRKYE